MVLTGTSATLPESLEIPDATKLPLLSGDYSFPLHIGLPLTIVIAVVVAVLLSKAGETRATIAGLVVAAFAVGGMVYSLSVRQLLRWFGQKQIMTAGGAFAALGLFIVAAGPPWPVQALAFAAMGCGFYMLHASIQVYVTEFAPATRSSAVAFHTFSFFIGGGISPILYGIGLEWLGAPVTLSIAGVAMVLIGAISAQLLVKPKPI